MGKMKTMCKKVISFLPEAMMSVSVLGGGVAITHAEINLKTRAYEVNQMLQSLYNQTKNPQEKIREYNVLETKVLAAEYSRNRRKEQIADIEMYATLRKDTTLRGEADQAAKLYNKYIGLQSHRAALDVLGAGGIFLGVSGLYLCYRVPRRINH